MWRQFARVGRLLRHRTIVAGLSSGLSIVGCAAVVWVESRAYGNMPEVRLETQVGVKGECCNPGAKTECSSEYPFACSTAGVMCDTAESSCTKCASPTCSESDNGNDHCDSMEYGSYTINATCCIPTSSYSEVCGTNMQHCPYVTSSQTAEYVGCGSSVICGVTSGAACQ